MPVPNFFHILNFFTRNISKSIKDVHREGEVFGQIRTPVDRDGVKDCADVRKLEFFLLFQHALQTLPMGNAY